VVSVANEGQLREIRTADVLKQRVERFFEFCFPTKTETIWKRFISQHAPLKLLSILLACVAWIVLAYQPATIQRTFIMPIEPRNLSERLVLDEPAPRVRFRRFGDSALEFELLGWCREPALRGRTLHSLNKAVVKRFREEGIVIPFPQRDVNIRGQLAGDR